MTYDNNATSYWIHKLSGEFELTSIDDLHALYTGCVDERESELDSVEPCEEFDSAEEAKEALKQKYRTSVVFLLDKAIVTEYALWAMRNDKFDDSLDVTAFPDEIYWQGVAYQNSDWGRRNYYGDWEPCES